MKQKIMLSFLIIFLISSLGAIFAYLHVRNTNDMLSRLINLHQIETLRQQLLRSIQTVQSDLYTVNTKLGNNLDFIVENVENLKQSAKTCTSCHHTPETAQQIDELQALIENYQESLSYYITASANAEQINMNKQEAARIGNKLLVKTEDMSLQASTRLKSVTTEAMQKVKRVTATLLATMLLALFLGVIVAVYLARAITRPIYALLDATRMITSGNLGYAIKYEDKTEFGELASHFNVMSTSLRTSYAKLEDEIGERKRTETALVKSESFLNTIFDSIRDPFCIIDNSYRIVRANAAYAGMKQMPLDELIGTICFETSQNCQDNCVESAVEKTFASGTSCTKEVCFTTPDGAKTWNVISTYPIMDSDGEITHVIEYSQDVTGRKWSEDALRESEERYALAALGSNDGLWDWDLLNNVIFFSSRWKSMLGYTDEEIGNQPEEWLNRIHPDDRPEIEVRIADHIGGYNSHFEDEFRILHKDGTYHWILTRGLAVRNAAGQAYRMAGSQSDITSNKTTTEQLVHNAFHDALTGLPNRSLFTDRLQHVIATSTRRDKPLYAVLFLDLDRFKIVNDSLGHLVGDRLLIEVGLTLSECIRPGDTVARLGGDEFSILLEDICELKDAVEIADRIHHKLSVPLILEGHEVYAAISIGIALGSKRYERAEHVLRDADIAMYEAKKRGSASSEIFDTTMHASILTQIKLESELHGGLAHNELALVYQPIIDLNTQRLIGFEALVRWNHPTRGTVYPTEFIPLAEKTGLIIKIGEWIMREACRELADLQNRFPSQPPLRMSINISGKQFAQENLADLVTRVLLETGVDPHSLTIEITESMLMENIDMAIASMNQVRAMGVHIHIDDFGTGYSSLSYLHSLPIDALKIDRSFTHMLNAHGENQEIIQSIMSLAKSLHIDVIAEGVEFDYQLEQLKELECRLGQGFLFSKPMEACKIAAWRQAQELKVIN